MESINTETTKKFIKINIPKDVRIILLLAIVLNILRILLFQSTYLIYILWNIFLAILPFIVSSALIWYSNTKNLTKPIFIVGSILWLLLLPNAPYIVTDLIHIGPRHGAPIFFDTFLLFSSAWAGLILWMYSMSHMEEIIKIRYSKRFISFGIPIIIFLTSIGMYIGRYLRFNSWDVFTHPSFFKDTFKIFFHEVHLTEAITFIAYCFLFLYMAYRAWKASKIS